MSGGRPPSVTYYDPSTSKSVPLPKVLALMSDHTPVPLTRAQLAVLARTPLQEASKGGYNSSTVGRWLSGDHQMPFRAYELVRAKLWFVEHGHATLDEVMNTPLDQLLTAKWPKPPPGHIL